MEPSIALIHHCHLNDNMSYQSAIFSMTLVYFFL
jgi:hypothetical protein